MTKKVISGISIVGVIGVSALYIYLAKLKWHGLVLNKEVKPIEVITLACATIIAITLQYYLVFAATEQRAEKDLLIRNVNDALDKIRACRDSFLTCYEQKVIQPSDQIKIYTQLRSLNHALEALEVSLGKSNCRQLRKVCDALKTGALSYKAVLTGGVFPAGPYPAETFTEHQKIYREVDEALQGLIFSINRA